MTVLAPSAQAWSDNGHRAIALIAQPLLNERAAAEVHRLLSLDDSGLAQGPALDEHAAWADRWRDSDRRSGQQRYRATRMWHYVNLPVAIQEATPADLLRACPTLAVRDPAPLGSAFENRVTQGSEGGSAASQGPARTCLVERVEAFAAELGDARVPDAERTRALQFLVHLLSDLHQPLHVGDADDKGGNERQVRLPNGRTVTSLHAFWDHDAVRTLGSRPHVVARRIPSSGVGQIDLLGLSARRWALESHGVARDHIHARLPAPGPDGVIDLTPADLEAVRGVAQLQLQRAGVRLAAVLNRVFNSPASAWRPSNAAAPAGSAWASRP